MKQKLWLLALVATPLVIHAQDEITDPQDEILDLKVELRADYQREYDDAGRIKDNCGFKGKYLNVALSGNINDHFSYSVRHRLNKTSFDSNFFDATDWAWVAYNVSNFEISAGKQVVGIGGFEYDRAPIDLYFCSEFWNNVACYQFGLSGAYTTDSGKDKLMFQVTQSPFRNIAGDMYAYNLMWYGNHGIFSSIYSVNMVEYSPGRYINYISLGNKFKFDKVSLELDLMNRATDGQTFFGKDMSVIGEISWKPTDRLNMFGKVSYDVNKTNNNDYYVTPGTELTRVGAGVEYHPFKNSRHDIRLHANYCYTFGDNGNTESLLRSNHHLVDVGFTWKFDVVKIKR